MCYSIFTYVSADCDAAFVALAGWLTLMSSSITIDSFATSSGMRHRITAVVADADWAYVVGTAGYFTRYPY